MFSIENGKVNLDISVVNVNEFITLVSYLSKFPLVHNDIKTNLSTSENSGILSLLSLLGYGNPVIKPSEFK